MWLVSFPLLPPKKPSFYAAIIQALGVSATSKPGRRSVSLPACWSEQTRPSSEVARATVACPHLCLLQVKLIKPGMLFWTLRDTRRLLKREAGTVRKKKRNQGSEIKRNNKVLRQCVIIRARLLKKSGS